MIIYDFQKIDEHNAKVSVEKLLGFLKV